MIILGIDPGYARCGIALIERWAPSVAPTVVYRMTVTTRPREPFKQRIHSVYAAVRDVIVIHGPAGMAVEAQRRAQAGHRERGTTSDDALGVREVMGLLRALAWEHGLGDILEVEPQAWRACLGLPATATKKHVERAVRARFGRCPAELTEHEADALGIAEAGGRLIPQK